MERIYIFIGNEKTTKALKREIIDYLDKCNDVGGFEMSRMTKKEINLIRSATFTEIKKILNEDWEILPEFFHIYDFIDKYGNHNYCAKGRQVAYDANIYKEVKEIFTINKKTKQAWEVNK